MTTPAKSRPLAIVTGASSGIGYELAKQCVANGFDLLVASDDSSIQQAAQDFQKLGAAAEAVEADLATTEESTSYWPPLADARSMPCSPTPAGVWAKASLIRILKRPGTSWKPISPARST